MEYPEEIYATRDGGLLTSKQRKNAGAGWGRRHAYNIGCARGYQSGYEAGKAEQPDYIESISSLESVLTDVEQLEGEDLAFVKRLIERTVRAVRAEQLDPLAGYSNLTAAIGAGEPIDWERLDGLKVQCVNPDERALHGKIERHGRLNLDSPDSWWNENMTDSYVNALYDGWHGKDGWTLWVEGEIPLVRKTADQLKVGHLFTGRKLNGSPREYLLCTSGNEEDVLVLWARDFTWTTLQARDWEVITDHGPLHKPEVN